MRRQIAAAIIAGLLLSGCNAKPELECTSESAKSVTVDLVKEQIRLAVLKTLSAGDSGSDISGSKVRDVVQQLVITLQDIRTAKQDPNSTKRFCTASLHVQLPENVVRDAESVRTAAQATSIADVADHDNLDQQFNTVKTSFDFDVQPTDDGTKVYAESDDFNRIRDFFGEVIGSAMLKPKVDAANASQRQIAAAQSAAEAAEKNATLAQQKTEDQLANQTINAVWRSIDAAKRSAMLPDQRAWIQKRTADCDLEAASASTDDSDRESARLKCDTRMTLERVAVLKQFAPIDDAPTNLLPAAQQ